jgi:signal transduction histidine kinase/CheY-like chemotaxis protein
MTELRTLLRALQRDPSHSDVAFGGEALLDTVEARQLELERQNRELREARRQLEQLRVLSDASAALGAVLEPSAMAASVTRLVVPVLADICFVDLFDRGDGQHLERAVALAEPSKAPLHEGLRRAPVADASSSAQERARLTGQTLHLHGRDCDAVVPEDLQETIGATSAVVVPLCTRDECVGVLTLLMTSGRVYGPNDVAVVEDLGRRMTAAIDNAFLYKQVENAVRARDDILSLVSHDLRNQLSAVLLGIASVVSGAPDTDRRKDRRRLDIVRRNAELMHKMTDDLLDLSSIEAGTLAISCESWSLRPLLQEALDSTSPLAKQRSIDLSMLTPIEDVAVNCDRERVLQVLANLIGNAVKFVPTGGRIVLRTEREPGFARILVEDNGPGIPKELQRRVFERRWQARETARKGHGLGLYISKKMVEGMGGRISVDSDLGRGATIILTLPLAEMPIVAGDGEVLIVDDNRDLRESVAHILTRNGYRVVEAGDGHDALELLRGEGRPCVVLLDLNMPRIDGRGFLAAVRADSRLAGVPVVLMSSERDIERRSTEFGVEGVLPKPFTEERLLEVVARFDSREPKVEASS